MQPYFRACMLVGITVLLKVDVSSRIAGMQDCVTVVSGGDDQAIRVAVFQCCTHAPATTAPDGLSLQHMQLTLLSSYQVVSAHTSAIRVSEMKQRQ